MPILLALLAAVTATAVDGDIVVRADGRPPRTVTRGGGFSDPAVSPDGRQVAFVHADAAGDTPRTSLWVARVAGGPPRRLLASRPDRRVERNMASFEDPHWSLDGGYLYVDADAWATSSAVHQVSVATGAERFVVEGGVVGVLRTGRWRGYLLVGQHKYRAGGGSYDPVSVVRPDGRVMFRVPGSDRDGEAAVPRWLRANGWAAS